LDTFYTLQEIADMLKMHIATVRELVRKGELAAYKVGKRDYRVSKTDFEAFLARHRTDGNDLE
jgi:putative molybdopterin biosynthesis protein